MAIALFSGFSAAALEAMKQLVRSKFPKVRQLSTEELARWLTDTNQPAALADGSTRVAPGRWLTANSSGLRTSRSTGAG